jgi:DNA-binding LacI/PurR family transcriptional regulator
MITRTAVKRLKWQRIMATQKTLKDVALQSKVSFLTAYHALSGVGALERDVQARVRAVADELGYKLNITLRDVAALANVSVATVSYVLNNSAPVSPQTTRRVMEAVSALGYRPNVTARNLKTARTRMIGYAWHNAQPDGYVNAVLDQFIYNLIMAAEACGYRLLTFAQTPQNPFAAYEELIHTNHVDGFILSNTNQDDERILRLLEKRIPFVSFGRSNEGWTFPYVDVDGQHGIRLATDHLIAQGHTQIAILAWPQGSLNGDTRLQGYYDGLAAAGLRPMPSMVVRTINSVGQAYDSVSKLLALPAAQRPTAIIALTDIMAIGAMRCIEDNGLRIGQDVAVTGFDDDPIAAFLRPSLTTVRQPIAPLAYQVIELLMAAIDGTSLPIQQYMFAPELVIRDSSGVKRA